MAYQPLEDLLPRSGYSIYKLVRMAANRATELADGKPPLIDTPTDQKTATTALEEILAGKVELKSVAVLRGPDDPKKKKAKEQDSKEQEEDAVANATN